MARYELNLRDYYRILRRHLIVIGAVSIGLGGMTLTLSSSTLPTFRASATVRITQATDLAGFMLQAFTWSSGENIATQTILISSQPVLLEAVKILHPTIPVSVDLDMAINDDTIRGYIADLEGRVSAEQVGYSGLINITATANDPEEAKAIANAVADGYEKYSVETSNQQNTDAVTFINGELDRIRGELATYQDSLKVFRQSNLPFSSSDAAALTSLIERRAILWDRVTTLSEMRLRLREGETGFSTIGISTDPNAIIQYSEIYRELTSLMGDRSRLLLTYTEEAEPVRNLDERISIVRGELIISIDKDIVLIRSRLDLYDRQLDSFPAEEVELVRLQRSVELKGQLVSQLETSLQEVMILSAGQLKEVTIVNRPTSTDPGPGGGAGLKTVIGLLLGLMLGVVIAFIVETMDTSIGTIEDVEEYIEVPVLAVIPHLPVEKMSERLVEQNPQLKDHPHLEMFARLITQYDPKSPAAEAYRTLRTNLQFAIGGTGESIETKNTFLLTSSSLQEGKSTTLANLAITIAQAGNRVLLMGCNMRRPTIYKSFGLTLENGMTDILTGQKEWRECVKGITDMMVGPLSLQNIMQMPGLDNLSIVTSGGIPPNPSELLSSPRFSQMIEEASEEYDIVLVDCPPILPVTDAAIIGRQVDWSILIYQVGKVPRNALRRAKIHLSNVGAHVLGLAMNDVKAEIGGYSPYSQYMIKYYGEEPEKKTLLGRVKDFFKKDEHDFDEKRERERPDTHRIDGAQTDASWIKVDYFNDIDQEPGEMEGDQDDVVEDTEPDEREAQESEDTGVGSWFNRIPLWAWVALAAAVILLVVSTLLGSCFDSSAQTVDILQPPATVERLVSPPAENPSIAKPPVSITSVWSIHVGSFKTPAEAESMKSLLGDLHLTGIDRIWTRTEEIPRLGWWSRVFVGMYEDREQCERSANVLRETGQVSIARVRHVTPPTP